LSPVVSARPQHCRALVAIGTIRRMGSREDRSWFDHTEAFYGFYRELM
jgi:hypothetical protein